LIYLGSEVNQLRETAVAFQGLPNLRDGILELSDAFWTGEVAYAKTNRGQPNCRKLGREKALLISSLNEVSVAYSRTRSLVGRAGLGCAP
jgi:hypothetical protein